MIGTPTSVGPEPLRHGQIGLDPAALARVDARLRFGRSFDHGVVGMGLVTPDRRFFRVNAALAEILGRPADELVGMSLSALTHPDDEARTLGRLQALYAGEIPELHLEKRYLRPDGAVIWSHVAIELVRNDEDVPVYTYIQVLDVTARVVAEAGLRRSEQTWRMTLDHAPHGIATVGLDGSFLHVNAALIRMLGYSERELLSTTFQSVTHAADLGTDLGLVMSLLSGDIASYMLNKRYRHADGHDVWAKLSVALVRDDSGAPLHFVSQIEDITEHRRRAEELRETQERFRLAFELAPVGMMLTDLTEGSRGSLLRVNQAMCRLLGYSAEELLRRTVSDLTHPEDRGADRQELGARHTRGGESATYENRYLRADGSTVWVMVHSGTVCDAAGNPEYAVTQVEEITVLRAERQRMADLALQDALTGVGNRALLNDRLELAVERTARRGSTLAVLYCDLDRFKPINDSFGHAAGDVVLQAVAGRIRTAIRPSDTIARIGGDEFVVVCEDLDREEQAEIIRQRILTSVAVPLILPGGNVVEFGVSVGLTTSSGPGLDAQELLNLADLAMYERKKAAHDLHGVRAGDAGPTVRVRLQAGANSPEEAGLEALGRRYPESENG
jgi:diguanylate cyclase (GGDEF)-like protein/PAS domain S-box-containing protein